MPPRSPVIFWLLLAATLAVDALVLSRVAAATFPAPFNLKIAYDALIISQINIVVIWAVLSSPRTRWLPALLAPPLAALIATIFSDDPVNFVDGFQLYLSFYGLAAALLFVMLWILRGTAFWRRRTNTEHTWRYSVGQLLVAMTVVAVLATTMQNGPFSGESALVSVLFTGSVALLAFWSALVWSSSLHAFLRWGAALGLALALGLAFWLATVYGSAWALVLGAHFVIQAIVLSAWLALGPILPVSTAAAGEPTSAPQS